MAINYKDEKIVQVQIQRNIIAESFKKTYSTIKSISENKKIFLFLLAFFLYIDGVHTVMSSAVLYAILLNLDDSAIIVGLLIVQFVAFPFTLIWAYVAERYNDKLVINLSILIYIGVI